MSITSSEESWLSMRDDFIFKLNSGWLGSGMTRMMTAMEGTLLTRKLDFHLSNSAIHRNNRAKAELKSHSSAKSCPCLDPSGQPARIPPHQLHVCQPSPNSSPFCKSLIRFANQFEWAHFIASICLKLYKSVTYRYYLPNISSGGRFDMNHNYKFIFRIIIQIILNCIMDRLKMVTNYFIAIT